MTKPVEKGTNIWKFPEQKYFVDDKGNVTGTQFFKTKDEIIDAFKKDYDAKNGVPATSVMLIFPQEKRENTFLPKDDNLKYSENTKVLFYDSKDAKESSEICVSGLRSKNVYVAYDAFEEFKRQMVGKSEFAPDVLEKMYATRLLYTAVSRRRNYVAVMDSQGINESKETKNLIDIIAPPPKDMSSTNKAAREELIDSLNHLAPKSKEEEGTTTPVEPIQEPSKQQTKDLGYINTPWQVKMQLKKS